MLVLGIDPGTATTGWGLVRTDGEVLALVEYGTVCTSPDVALPQRLQTIYRELGEIFARHQPSVVAVEKLFFNKNARTAMAVGQARGVVLLAVADAGLPLHEYTPLEVKLSVCGYGRASKEQVQKLVQMLLGLDFVPQPDDAADALAVAICHLHSSRLEDLVAKHEGAA
jgi:crossover junction endodeoxyribonuclease RuvC